LTEKVFDTMVCNGMELDGDMVLLQMSKNLRQLVCSTNWRIVWYTSMSLNNVEFAQRRAYHTH